MKKIIWMMILAVLLTGCEEKACNPNESICIDEETYDYILEEDPTVVMSFENQEQQEAFIALWDETYPELQGVLQGVIYEDDTYQSFIDQPADLVLLDSHYATLSKANWQNFDEHLKETIYPHLSSNMLVDETEFFFLPLYASGSNFIVNTNVLSEMGISLEDENEDGLIDAIDSFEKWQELGLSIDVFLDDWTFSYAFMMIDLELFEDISLESNPFESEEVLQHLYDVASLSEVIKLSDLTYEQFFEEENVAVALMQRWMYYLEEDPSVMVISKLPTVNERQLENLIYAKGYVLNAESTSKNTAHKVMELLYTQQGLQIMMDTSESIVVYPLASTFETEIEVEYDENGEVIEEEVIEPYTLNYPNEFDKMIAESYQYGVLEDYQAVETEVTVRYFDCLDDVMFQEVCVELYYEMITAEQAQEILVSRYESWIGQYRESEDEVSS
ncbi:MAG: hypothetical protein R3Y57_02845 [Erysipelotrichaceae bacterium]